jgi:kinesin family protein 3/17
VNGTILAYGQTGIGKTYMMGILECVRMEHAGIIPRALSHIFGHIAQHADVEFTVTMSMLQIYLETVQDLLVLPSEARADENLAIREAPRSGFFVEGLKEYEVRSYADAVELLNWGLDNRVMASTLMNVTSSRSHVVLTVTVSQRSLSGGVTRSVRAKLMLVDLAGSERVSKTSSR